MVHVRMDRVKTYFACLHQSPQSHSVAVVSDVEDQLRTDSVARHGEERWQPLRYHRSDAV